MSLIGLILKFILSLRYPSHVSIADVTRRRYGEAVLDCFRSWERAIEKYQKCLADIVFLEACKDADLVPRFLLFKLANRKLKRSSEATRSRRRLLDVELRNKIKCRNTLKESMHIMECRFKQSIRPIDFVKYRIVVDETVERRKVKWHNTHQNKFINLRAHHRSDAGLLDPDSVITNLSDHELSELEKLALANIIHYYTLLMYVVQCIIQYINMLC